MWLDGNPDKDGNPTKTPALRPDAVYFHVPNGGARSPMEGKRFKETGVKPGVHDLLFVCQRMLFGLELKAPGKTTSDAQKKMHARLLDVGMSASAVCDSLARAKEQLISWNLARDC